jgi:hypothetical protein
VGRPRSIAGATPSADEIVALDDGEHDAKEIAAKVGCSERHVVEVLRVEESGIPELKRLIRKPRSAGGIIPRAAARIAVRDEPFQRRVLKKLIGRGFMEANRIIQAEEQRVGQVNRGRKPTMFDLDEHARARCSRLADIILRALSAHQSPRVRARALAHVEILLLISGKVDVEDLYRPSGKPTRLLSTATAKNLLQRATTKR